MGDNNSLDAARPCAKKVVAHVPLRSRIVPSPRDAHRGDPRANARDAAGNADAVDLVARRGAVVAPRRFGAGAARVADGPRPAAQRRVRRIVGRAALGSAVLTPLLLRVV